MLRAEFERRKRGLTQRQLGDLAGILQYQISMLERGRFNPSEEELIRLANALRVHPPGVLLKQVLVAPDSSEQPA